MQIGDKLYCIETIFNVLGDPLFTKNQIYEVLDINGDGVTLNHRLYGNEYYEFYESFINEKFIDLKTLRLKKLKQIKNGST